MKRFLAFLMVLVLMAPAFSAFAEDADTGSEFEKMTLKKGSLIVQEIVDYCEIEDGLLMMNEKDGLITKIKFQTASVLDVETGEKVYALRMVGSALSDEVAVGVMDEDDVDEVIRTLEYIKKYTDQVNKNSEVVYTSESGIKVGEYYDRIQGGKLIYIQLKPVTSNLASPLYCCESENSIIDNIINAFQGVKATFGK